MAYFEGTKMTAGYAFEVQSITDRQSTSTDDSLFHGNISSSGDIKTEGDFYGSNLFISASGENTIRVGNSGDYMTKWEWYRNDDRKWVKNVFRSQKAVDNRTWSVWSSTNVK